MDFELEENNALKTPKTPFKRIWKILCYITASIAISFWLSSCNKGKSSFSKYYPKVEMTSDSSTTSTLRWNDSTVAEITWWNFRIVGGVNVDVTGWYKKIEIIKEWWYYRLIIWNKEFFRWDRNCQYTIKSEDWQIHSGENLEIDESKNIYVILKPLIDSELISSEEFDKLESYVIVIRLSTTQEMFVSWLDKLKKLKFQVGKPADLTKYIKFHNVEKEKITIKYPNGQEETLTGEDLSNFIPKYSSNKPAKLNIKVINAKGESINCIALINISAKDREPIEPILESPKLDEVFPNLNAQLSDNEYKYVEENLLVLYQMIQSILHTSTTNNSSKEIKEYAEKILIAFVWDNPNWNHEITWWNISKSIEELPARNGILRSFLPNVNIKRDGDVSDNSWPIKMLDYAQSHKDENIIICCPSHKDNDQEESNYENEINELHKLGNVLILEEWTYSDISLATLWMILQLSPNLKKGNNLQALYNLSTHLDKSKIFSIIKDLLPNNLSYYTKFSDNDWKLKLWEWEYPFIIFDIPWTILAYNSEDIPCDKEHWYILKDIDLSTCNQFFVYERLIEWWYFSWKNFSLWWSLIIKDYNWKKLIDIPVSFELNNGKVYLEYRIH